MIEYHNIMYGMRFFLFLKNYLRCIGATKNATKVYSLHFDRYYDK